MVAHPHDKGPIYITASTNGYFVNGGLAENTKDLNFEKKSIFFKDLMSLLRKENAHFSFMIEQQDIFVLEEPTEEKRLLGIAHISPRVSSTRLTHHSSAGEPAAQILAGDKADSSGPMNEKLKSILSGGETKKDGRRHPKKTGKIKLDHIADRKHAKTDSTKQKSSGKKKHGEDSSSSGPDDNEEAEKCTDKFELPPDYWLIQKYMKFIRSGNPVATLFAISSMMDLDLNHDGIQLGIRDLGGVELLINLMEANDLRCQIGALHILKMISMNCAIRQFIADLGGIQIMVKLLRSSNFELRCLSAETIAHIARFRRARRIVRRNNGIANLIAMLDIGSDKSLTKSEEMEAARCAALAMFSCCKSHGNRVVMRQAGIVPILSKLLSLPDPAVLTPVVGILHECAQELQFLVSMRTEGMLGNIIKCLNEDGVELQTVCASALFVCATERESRDLIRQLGGLRRLVGIVSTAKDKKLLAAASGAIWKCAISVENCTELHKFEAIVHLVKLLLSQPEEPEEVLVNVVGALAEMAKLPINSKQIRQFNGVPPLISLLKKTNPAILINAAKAVGYCAEDLDNMALIDKLDGVALIWSLLKNPNEDVQASAARALCPCIQNAKDSGEMVRSFIGGLEFVVRLLKSSNPNVLASACAIIASIAKDEENLAVLTDHGVVPMLARLACTDSERLRHHLSEAIGCCCSWADNRVQFGKEDAVRPLVGFLRTTDEEVLRSCTKALHELSKDPDNCITMHDVGVVKRMLELVASRDPVVQVSAAGCISNIRRLALANENFHYQHIS